MTKFVVIAGNVIDGLTLYGPFNSASYANEWADDHLMRDTTWVSVALNSPVDYVVVSYRGPADERLYWSNEDGWVGDLESATRYSEAEKKVTQHLPVWSNGYASKWSTVEQEREILEPERLWALSGQPLNIGDLQQFTHEGSFRVLMDKRRRRITFSDIPWNLSTEAMLHLAVIARDKLNQPIGAAYRCLVNDEPRVAFCPSKLNVPDGATEIVEF